MTTITLQHVTKRYDSFVSQGNIITNVSTRVARGMRMVFDRETARYFDETQAHHEPPDRENALDDLSLTIRTGETLAVLGPSGCGKTTLLKVIAGIMAPDEGKVLYDGSKIDDIPAMERGIGMVFQNYALYPHLIARDNIAFFDLIHKQPERIPERLHHVAEVMGVDIKYLLTRKPPTLSGGERQRVAVARCLARDPKVFLFDEPLSNLDAKRRIETRIQIKRLLLHYKITSVYVTHDQAEAISLADRIAIMRAGKIEQTGTYQALYEAPVNAFVAQFFGTPPMNLFSGHVDQDSWYGAGFSVQRIRPGLLDGQPVHLGIRPEHIELVDDGIPAKIEFIEPHHALRRQLLYAQVGRQRCTVEVPLQVPVEAGHTVFLRFPPDCLYLFDGASGQRIG
ncbi:MAG: ABC transporter ATP-binding protein [Chloroflexi bacterium]|nr:ABC transporter ATP-binding protein [Chloroflexota bacterium]